MIAPPFLADEELVHRFRCSPRVLLRCAYLWGVSKARAPWLGWISLLFLPFGGPRCGCFSLGVVLWPSWAYRTSCGRCFCLVSCSNSLIKRWLVRRSASISFVLSCIVSRAPAEGRLSTLPYLSCILGGLMWLLLVFRVDTISY